MEGPMWGGETHTIAAAVFGTLAAMTAASILVKHSNGSGGQEILIFLVVHLVLLLKPAGLLCKAGIEKV
jgi:branched-subunit amino acid ABC-type transport system permease component